MLQMEVRLVERQAQNHFQHFVQLKVINQPQTIIVIPCQSLCSLPSISVKVFLAWREVTTHAVSRRHQQGEVVMRAQRSIHQGKNRTPFLRTLRTASHFSKCHCLEIT